MKTEINEPKKIALVNQLAGKAAIRQQYEFDETLPDVLTDIDLHDIAEEKPESRYSRHPKKHYKLIQGLLKSLRKNVFKTITEQHRK